MNYFYLLDFLPPTTFMVISFNIHVKCQLFWKLYITKTYHSYIRIVTQTSLAKYRELLKKVQKHYDVTMIPFIVKKVITKCKHFNCKMLMVWIYSDLKKRPLQSYLICHKSLFYLYHMKNIIVMQRTVKLNWINHKHNIFFQDEYRTITISYPPWPLHI